MAAPAGPASSSLFAHLGSAWRLLSLRSDVDSIILELLGTFSLEKIYAEGDKETYQHLVITLIAQLNTILHIQRLSLPSENQQIGWYLGFLVSWEVALRSVEFVLQTVVEGRESLWDADALRDKYLAEFLLSSLRFLTLHPKAPAKQTSRDRRDRFARIHRSLERVFDSYGGDKSFLLMVCKEVTDTLRTDPDSLGLPPPLRYSMPNLASELYPIPECLSPQVVLTLVPVNGFAGDWLAQFLALRDVSSFVVGASVQYTVNRELRDFRLQASSARTRNAVLHALENMRIPGHLSKVDLISSFSETFRIILPETPSLARRLSPHSSQFDESEIDAIEQLCVKLNERQVLSRVSDREMMHSMSEVTKTIATLDDPSGLFRASRPRLYAVNCENIHVFGDTHLRNLGYTKFPSDTEDDSECGLPPDSTCATCGQTITIMREVSVVKNIWDLLKPLEPNADTINVERHLPTQFQQAPPKADTGLLFNSSYGSILASQSSRNPGSASPHHASPERNRSIPPPLLPPVSPGFRQFSELSRGVSSEAAFSKETGTTEPQRSNSGRSPPPFSPTTLGSPVTSHTTVEHIVPNVSFDPVPVLRSRTVPLVQAPEKGRSKWRPKFGSRKESAGAPPDTSSLSSTTLEGQRLEEIPLNELNNPTKKTARGKPSKTISVSLSQNSSYVLFWSQLSIYIWDIGVSPPVLGRAISTDSTCVLAAATKVHLAYIIGTRDQKLTLRIVNLIQQNVQAVEYRMPSSLWCRTIAISDSYVVVGFDNSLVRFFSTKSSEEPPREDHLHSRYHTGCKECQPVETLSFSNDGLVLLASTRSPKSGMIQVYQWRFPFSTFEEVPTCRYQVPLHESEDGGISSAIYRSGSNGEENLICLTSWTQSGSPILVQPNDGHRTDIRTEISNRKTRLGNRIQSACFSPSGKELAIVNDQGDLYKICHLNSSPMDVKKIATSRELTAKSDSFAMSFMTMPDEDCIVLAWVDASKGVGYVKKVPATAGSGVYTSQTAHVYTSSNQRQTESPKYELPADSKEPPPLPPQEEPAELVSPTTPSISRIMKGGLGTSKNKFF